MNHIDVSDNICKELSISSLQSAPSSPISISDIELGELIHLNLNQTYIFFVDASKSYVKFQFHP